MLYVVKKIAHLTGFEPVNLGAVNGIQGLLLLCIESEIAGSGIVWLMLHQGYSFLQLHSSTIFTVMMQAV